MFCLPNLKRHKIELKTAKAKENIQEKKKKKRGRKKERKRDLKILELFLLKKSHLGGEHDRST